jgi:hypothetical protein
MQPRRTAGFATLQRRSDSARPPQVRDKKVAASEHKLLQKPFVLRNFARQQPLKGQGDFAFSAKYATFAVTY